MPAMQQEEAPARDHLPPLCREVRYLWGATSCARHTVPTPYGDERFCKKCRRKGEKLMRMRRALDREERTISPAADDLEQPEMIIPISRVGPMRKLLLALMRWW